MLVVTLREGWFMGRVIVTEDEFAPSILVMVSVHDLGLFTREVYKLPKVEHRARPLMKPLTEERGSIVKLRTSAKPAATTCSTSLRKDAVYSRKVVTGILQFLEFSF